MKEYRASPNAMIYWMVRLTLLALAPFGVSVLTFGRTRMAWTVFTLGWVLAYLFLAFFWYPVKRRKLKIQVTEEQLAIRTGVLYTRWKYMNYGAVQYLSLCTLPLQRVFRVTSVVVYGSGCFLFIPCLHRNDAQELQDLVTPAAKRMRFWE